MPRIAVAAVCLAALAACSSPKGTYIPAGEVAALESNTRAVAAAGLASGGSASASEAAVTPRAAGSERVGTTSDEYVEKMRGFDGRERDLIRRREDLAVDRADHQDRLAAMRLEHETAEAQEALAQMQAQNDRDAAAQDLERFRKVVRDRRLREDELELQRVHDHLLETREELAQLELMYGDDELGDATAEIVLQRTRRRLTRAEEQHHIAREKSAELREVTLPREERELALALELAQAELVNAQRDARAGEHDRAVARRELDREARALDREEADLHREEQELQGDLRRWEQSLS